MVSIDGQFVLSESIDASARVFTLRTSRIRLKVLTQPRHIDTCRRAISTLTAQTLEHAL